MTPQEEFSEQGHVPHLRAFLESPTGRALMELVEDYGKPSNESRKQYGDAEDVKLQMSLNYVAMEQTFAVVKFIKGLIKPISTRHQPHRIPDLIPENATPAQLEMMGIIIPSIQDFRKTTAKESVPEPSVN